MIRIYSVLFFITLFTFMSLSSFASAKEWRNDTGVLPQYCKDRAKGLGPKHSKWRRKFGEVYVHMHHYCSGVYAEYQYKVKIGNKRQRSRYLFEVRKQMRYVANVCKEKCVIYPAVHRRLAWALGEEGKISDAIQHYKKAIKAKSTFTKAYAGLADLYIKHGQSENALNILNKGLEVRPKSKMLKRRLKELKESS